ncbi:MAG: sigma-54-dependent Fis family transcriptional regulator [Paracoccus denitrificans]|uniref:Sigma-54-dependent Fis family transcriptional regulator n=1 Tax=Paracoccus denitrificans TaxID=266 RepID=A0A533I2E3_PARDE|nr:MAG: sigma-54-dependent Fis family transcriptional regulator [Paracoccus denitrificans]
MAPKSHADFVVAQSRSDSAGSALVTSWRRSMMKYGLDPSTTRLPTRISDAALRERRDAMSRLVDVANPQLDRLYALVGLSGCSVLLTDSDGVVLAHRVRDGEAAQFRDWGLSDGFDWSEAAQGTNGIGTCLAEGRALTISRDEHFHTRNVGLSCMDAPIWGPDGRLIAALDVSAAQGAVSDGLTRLIEAQVIQSASAIEALLFRASYQTARIVVADDERSGAAALIAVDKDDLTIGATRAARRTFGLPRQGEIKPRPATDLLAREDDLRGFEKGERAAIARALARSDGNVSAAAKALGIGRATLYRRMAKLGPEHK